MGSYFLHDDYRLTDMNNIGTAYKDKSGSTSQGTSGTAGTGASQGLFEGNVCYTNIKRGLGFDTTASNGESPTDDWTSRARSSPVVERLIFQELQSDIIEYASSIGVAMDPRQWGVEDTLKWLRWVGNLYHIGDLTNCLSYDGPTLCAFTEEDFILLTGTKDVGQRIAAQLDIWKKVTSMTPSAGSYHFQQQQAMEQKLGTVGARTTNNTPKLLDTGCWQTPTQQRFTGNTDSLSSNQFGRNLSRSRGNFPDMRNNRSEMSTSSSDVRSNNSEVLAKFSELRGNSSEMRGRNSFQLFNLPNQQLPFHGDQMLGRSTPRPTIPLDRFRSVREAFQDNGYLPWEKYQEFTSMTPATAVAAAGQTAQAANQNTQNMMFANAAVAKEDAASTAFQMNGMETKEEPSTATPSAPSAAADSEVTSITPIVSEVHSEFTEVKLLELKTEKTEQCSSEVPMDTMETQGQAPSDKPVKKKSAKHPIHLWEFLKQLLYDGKECIRWIDQERGVFKIYNSQEVAKFWGERKNRPAMNYDKLSRSIRQYYKKGIIKKTSQGKRLVYQFCEGYL